MSVLSDYLRKTSRRNADFDRFRKAVLRQGTPDHIPVAEVYMDDAATAAVLGEKLAPSGPDIRRKRLHWNQKIRFHRLLGMDFVMVPLECGFAKHRKNAPATDDLRESRSWVSEDRGPLATREDAQRYRWPRPEDVDYWPLEYVSRNLPEGMRIIAGTDGPFEIVRELMGFSAFAESLLLEPDFVSEIFERVGSVLLSVHRAAVQAENVGAVHMWDDMAYKTGPMVSPALLRRFAFPWHRRCVENAHARGLPFTLHSDGNNDLILEDLLSSVGIDGKHAFEDAAQPVEEVKRKYGGRVSLIGGMDMDLLCRGDEAVLRKRIRSMVETCGAGGGYAFGTGSGLTTYTPPQRYLLFLNEAWDLL